ncbi:alkaline phosphatase family protein [Candidatus Methylocalor cossyra]|uniref:Phosphoesterase n=1 Tax=Candidatus Methylocalor cossyra TaxID=3108543 RepID=A0ABP1C7X5_9GAMM
MSAMEKFGLSSLSMAVTLALSQTANAAAQAAPPPGRPATPIEHVIVIVGENHSFDNIFGGYRPRNGQTVLNLLSQGIIRQDGKPGPHFDRAAQKIAQGNGSTYELAPKPVDRYKTLPQPDTTYATGQPQNTPDLRFPADLPNGPFQLTRYVSYSAFLGDPVHRFFQMWQQYDKGANDLYVWVASTAGTGNHTSGNAPDNTHQGGVAMGFYNMSTGDAPLFEEMAREYAISDNYHQAVMGGTGANFIALVTGDAAFYNDGGNPAVPPTWTLNGQTVSEIENPNPQPNAANNSNWYTEDGYNGGSFVACADPSQPGVGEIQQFLKSKHVDHNCENGKYYLVNNYQLGYKPDGTPVDYKNTPFVLPPQPASLPTIADKLAEHNISWKYYSGDRRDGKKPGPDYCGICDPLTGFKSIMENPAQRANLQDVTQLYQDLADEKTMPAVAFVRPFETMAGHPANSLTASYENFVTDLVNRVRHNPALWEKTAIFITMDEGGGYYDSGYIQQLDFFGDGPRIPLIAVSPYAKKGFVDHTYSDHASILKFIVANWGLGPLSNRSRDRLPNPVASPENPYVPSNGPAIGDLMTLFDFSHPRQDAPPITVPKVRVHALDGRYEAGGF